MTTAKTYFIDGAISPELISRSIVQHEKKTDCGAHSIFLGQVRADAIENHVVTAIEYQVYDVMANIIISEIREEALQRFSLRCLHVHHSRGLVEAGKISLFVFSSSKHRQAAIEACSFVVEEIKARVPVWGREILSDGTSFWKKPNLPQRSGSDL